MKLSVIEHEKSSRLPEVGEAFIANFNDERKGPFVRIEDNQGRVAFEERRKHDPRPSAFGECIYFFNLETGNVGWTSSKKFIFLEPINNGAIFQQPKE